MYCKYYRLLLYPPALWRRFCPSPFNRSPSATAVVARCPSLIRPLCSLNAVGFQGATTGGEPVLLYRYLVGGELRTTTEVHTHEGLRLRWNSFVFVLTSCCPPVQATLRGEQQLPQPIVSVCEMDFYLVR